MTEREGPVQFVQELQVPPPGGAICKEDRILKRLLFVSVPLWAGLLVLATVGCVSPAKSMDDMMDDEMMKPKMARVTLANISGAESMATPLAPGVWALVAADAANPLFTADAADAGHGLEALAEDGDPSALAAHVASLEGVIASGVFNTPDGADGPGPALPGASYSFTVTPEAGAKLYFATMFVQSNDLFFGPGEGIELLAADGMLVMDDASSQVQLWDAGTEQNEEPGVGPNQAPRQAGPNTGPDENGMVRVVGTMYPGASRVVRVSIAEEMMKDEM